jgi:hypothetical protein
VTSDGEKAIDALARTLDALDDHLRSSDATAHREQRNRLGMLHLHAVAAMYIGPLFALVGKEGMTGAAWALIRSIPGAPYSLGGLLFTGGLVLGWATWKRHVRWEMIGLCVLLTWYLIIAVSFGAGAAGWYLGGRRGDGARPAPYTHGIYLHFSAVMLVHLGTLVRIRRARRKAAR